MKEVMAVIRMNMINKTKEALLKEGFPSIYVKKVSGRGKRKVDFSLIEELLTTEEIQSTKLATELDELHRLLPKRLINIVVKDEEVEKVVKTIIDVNRTGNPGDGKIFVANVSDVVRVRTGETGEAAV